MEPGKASPHHSSFSLQTWKQEGIEAGMTLERWCTYLLEFARAHCIRQMTSGLP